MTKDEALAQSGRWTLKDMAYRPGALVRTEPAPTPEQLAALGWQSIECPFCGTSGAQAFPKSETDWEGIAADQAMTIALMKSEQPEQATEKEKISRSMTAEIVDSRESAQPTEQVSVARIGMIGEDHFADVCSKTNGNSNTPLYAAPPKREWVGLNWGDLPEEWVGDTKFLTGARWAEQILEEKNT